MKLKETLAALLALSLTACGTPEIVLVPDPAPFEDYAGSREEDSSPVELPED